MLTIDRVSFENPADVADWVAVQNATSRHDLPGQRLIDDLTGRNWLEHPWPGRLIEQYVARLDGVAVGRVDVRMPTLDNLTNLYLEIDVVPEQRRKGFGRKLYEHAVDRARANGRSHLVISGPEALPDLPVHDGGAAPAFAKAMGLDSANLPEVMRRLEIPAVDEGRLEELYTGAQAVSAGYRLVQWQGAAPEELVEDLAYLDGRLLEDAPTGDLQIEPDKVDAERFRAIEAMVARRGSPNFHTVAVHEATGRAVAWTSIHGEAHIDWHVWQGITIVAPEHRGHRLGILVKVANLRYLRSAAPAVTTVDTGNAAENSYMISINEQMGFRPTYSFQTWQRDLD